MNYFVAFFYACLILAGMFFSFSLFTMLVIKLVTDDYDLPEDENNELTRADIIELNRSGCFKRENN
jgi:hypothetical protein